MNIVAFGCVFAALFGQNYAGKFFSFFDGVFAVCKGRMVTYNSTGFNCVLYYLTLTINGEF